VVGAQDLNQYGDWEQDDDYGTVWYPTTVAADWAPYRFGHWAWIGPWGWTWVDSLPWGFAPYHYGRWVHLRNRWGWIPCPPRTRPVYAPALVAFVGIGRGGPVGWFPLGPHEVYNPWYRASRNYYTNVNVNNIRIARNINRMTVINNIHNQYNFYRNGRPVTGVNYANRDAPHAFTAVSAQAFANARNVQGHQLRMDPKQLASASVMSPTTLQRPLPTSFGPPRNANARPLPAAGFNRPVVAVRAPAAAAAASFHAGQPASNVRVLNVPPHAAQRVVSGQAFPRYNAPVQPQAVPRPAAPALPQVPHFAPAEQIHQVQQAPHYVPPQSVEQAPRYTPSQPSMQQDRERQAIIEQQQRFDAAQRAHQYVPEQPQREIQAPREVRPAPSYQPQPYRYQPMPQQYAHPEVARPEAQPHPQQSAPHPHYTPPSKNDNQH
jgi:uncharacterized protein YkuJ